MKSWWGNLAERERWLMGSGVVLSGLLLFYVMVWEPFDKAHQQLRKSVAQQRAELLWMKQAALEIQRLGQADSTGDGSNDGRSLLTVVDETARTMGVSGAMKQAMPQGDDKLNAQLDNVTFDQLLPWVGALEKKHAVVLVNLRMDKAGGPGRVNARLLLQR